MGKLNRLLTNSISCFSYTLVVSGNAKVKYNDIPLSIEIGNMLITTPGTMVWTIEVSDDFLAMCLMCDEVTTYEIPFARNIIKASYFTGMKIADNKLSLTDCELQCIERRMKEIHVDINSDHIYKSECLQSLYSLFILDLLNVKSRHRRVSECTTHSIDLFLKFCRLLTQNFLTEHEIGFYADRLAVTPIYLSRIVKRVSGMTVKVRPNGHFE